MTHPAEIPLVLGEKPVEFTPSEIEAKTPPQPEPQPEQPAPRQGKAEIGERGTAKVNSANRNAVRKWLTENGLPYSSVGGLTIEQLSAAYNDTTDKAVNALLQAAGKGTGQGDKGGQGGQGTQGEQGTQGTQGEGQGEQGEQGEQGQGEGEQGDKPLNDAQKAVQTLAKSVGLNVGGADEKTIRKIAKEEAEKAAKAKGREKRIVLHSPLGVKDLGERHLHPLFEQVVKALSVDVACLVVGPAGSGKTTLAEQASEALGIDFHFSGAVLKKHELLGYRDANGNVQRTAFRDAFENGGLFLFDEIDASSANALVCVNAALANKWCDFPDGRIKAHPSFRIIASANTNGDGATREYAGRNQLDGATKDRFATFLCDYDDELTARLVGAYDLPDDLKAIALEWHERVCDYRKALSVAGIRGIISPRCSLGGAKLIRAGFTVKQLEDCLVLNKFGNADDRKRLKANADVITEARKAPKAPAESPTPTASV